MGTTYICKCGREISKSTTAENTGNRDTAGCTGCPYLLPYGKFEYKPGGFQRDVQGYECRMSPSIDYTTTYMGQADDKCTLRIVSLDFDFLDKVQAWINAHADGNLSGGFSREDMRGTDFSNNGRYSWSIACAQNRKGMAAKAALIEHFFGPDRRRLDKTQAEEKAIVLAAIEVGKAKDNKKEKKMDYIISECEQNDLLYAYYKKEFWFWDEHQNKWVVSDFARARFEKALQTSPQLTPEDFMTNGDEFWKLDEWEVSTEQINALELVKVERKSTESDRELIKEGTDARRQVHSRARIECGSISAVHVCDKKPDDVKIWLNAMAPAEYWVLNSGDDPCGEPIEVCPYCGANLKDGAGDVMIVPFPHAAQSQQNCENAAEVQQAEESESHAQTAPGESGKKSLSAAEPAFLENGRAFDYSGLDIPTVDTLHWAEGQIREARRKYIADVAEAVAIVHEALVQNLDGHNQYSEETFVSWCRSVGMSKSTAYNLLQVNVLLTDATPEEAAQLEQASPSLLYAAAKPSAPAELVQAVKDGDITTHKQYQEAMAKIRSLESENKQLKHENEMERKEQQDANATALHYKNECDRRAKDQQRVEGLLKTTTERAENAERRAQVAEKDAEEWKSTGLQMQEIVDQKDERIRDLESGITVEATAVDQDEIERRANEITEPLAKIIDQQGKEIKRLASGSTVSAQASILNQYLQTMIVSLLGNAHRSELTSYDIGALDRLARTLQDFADAIENLFNESEDDQDGE